MEVFLKIKVCKIAIIFTLLIILSADSIHSQDDITPECIAEHDIGKLVLKSNSATLFGGINLFDRKNCLNNNKSFYYGAEYPKGSGISSLYFGELIIGGILNDDTLVSIANSPVYWKKYRSTLIPNSPNYEGAVSEQDYISVSVDNIFGSIYNPSIQKPLNIQVTKKSYSWSYEYAEDFVLFDIEIKNIGEQTIKDAYIGLLLDFAVGYYNEINNIGIKKVSNTALLSEKNSFISFLKIVSIIFFGLVNS